MKNDLFTSLILGAPLLFILTSLLSHFQGGLKPTFVIRMSLLASLTGMISSVYAWILVLKEGVLQISLFDFYGLGFSFRLDTLSTLMFTMIALLSFIVLKFSFNYLDGDNRHGIFIGRLAATIASVQLFVLSGNLLLLLITWVLTSLTLHRLLVFYPDRPKAVIASKKKFILARIGDFCLIIAIIFLYKNFHSGNLQVIFDAIKNNSIQDQMSLEVAAVFLALAAILKSAQFPTHGWLIEVVETPTPVSALLHAGLLNAGPFLMVRMAYVMNGFHSAQSILIVVGGLTAFFASVTFLTQPAIKTALGYSSVAHMGFMLLVCGMGVYPAVMLHLVAHSFYKAHAFLSSGSTIDVVRASKVALPKRMGSAFRITASIGIAMLVYLGFSFAWGINPIKEFALMATGAIVVMGLTQIIAPTLDSDAYLTSIIRACISAILVATSFFTLEHFSHLLLLSELPEIMPPDLLRSLLTAMILILFGLTVLAQLVAPINNGGSNWDKIRIHFRNGWYANALFDRIIGSLDLKHKKQF